MPYCSCCGYEEAEEGHDPECVWYDDDINMAQNLGEVEWMLIGSTNEYTELKKDIGHVCSDVTKACCIDEICINDIIKTFEKHGYSVIKGE